MMEIMFLMHLVETLALAWLVIRDFRNTVEINAIKNDNSEFLSRLTQLEGDMVKADSISLSIKDMSAAIYGIEKQLERFIEANSK